jgi:transposase-like protein
MEKKENRTVSEIINDIDALSVEEQQEVAKMLFDMFALPVESFRKLGSSDYSEIVGTVVCPYCGKTHVVKNGFAADKVTRRYKCLDCNRTFRRTTNSVVSNSHKDTSTWEQFILLTLKGASLATCSKRCKIAMATAFTWRHKLLSVLSNVQQDCMLGSITEMDETFVALSFKGNHKKFLLPRKACKRGSDNKDRTKACVFCAVERGVQSFAQVVCRGNINSKLMQDYISKHFKDEMIAISDGLRVYRKFFKNAPQEHIAVNAKYRKSGTYHINNINSFHARLKEFLAGYHGVATKYLNNYVSLFVWLENARIAAKNSADGVTSKVLEFGSYRSAKSFDELDRQPALAPVA